MLGSPPGSTPRHLIEQQAHAAEPDLARLNPVLDAGMTSDWFPGTGRTADDKAFLTALRAAADEHGLIDATPADTGLIAWEESLVVVIELPGLQSSRAAPTLEVIAHLAGDPGLSCGVEIGGYLADLDDPMDLRAVERTPGGLARHAFRWLTAQVARPVEQATWSTWRGKRTVLRFADDGELIASSLGRRPRRPPDRIVQLRPGSG